MNDLKILELIKQDDPHFYFTHRNKTPEEIINIYTNIQGYADYLNDMANIPRGMGPMDELDDRGEKRIEKQMLENDRITLEKVK